MCDLLTPSEQHLLDALPDLRLPTGTFGAPGRPNLAAGTVTLVDAPSFRAYLVTAGGRYEVVVATKGANTDRRGRTGRRRASGVTLEGCRRVALAYFLGIGRRVQDAQA